jgi:hypothetical protein
VLQFLVYVVARVVVYDGYRDVLAHRHRWLSWC